METPSEFGSLPGAALVTGGTGAIGAAVVEALVEGGSDVVFTYRTRAEEARRLTKGRDGQVRAIELDLQAPDTVESAVAETAAAAGGLHTLVYASGPHVPMVHLSNVPAHQMADQLNADAAAFFTLARAALEALRASGGSIVAVTTAASMRHPVRDGLSTAPKAAVEAVARGLATEEGRFGVRVNCVGPGMLTDGMAARLIDSGDLDDTALEATRRAIPLRTFGTAADVAEAVRFLASPRAGFVTGQKLNVDGGYST